MRLLFLTCHLPFPPHSGGRLREHQLLSRLTGDFDVHVAAVTKTPDEDDQAVARIPWRHDGVSLFPAAQLCGIAGVAPQVSRHRSPEAAAGVRELLARGRFDAVHVEGFYLWQHVAGIDRPPTVLVEQNVEWQLYEQRGLRAEAQATKRAELATWRTAEILGPLTAEDWAVIRSPTGRVAHLVPDGADHLPSLPPLATAERGRRVLMVGNFGYEPNVDGALWLVEQVMPQLRRAVPGVQLQLVGVAPPREIRSLACDDIEVTGRVPDVAPYMQQADVVLCPLRVGGGVKVKVLEALRAGKAIVSTPVGCQGLGAARRAVDVASTAEHFAAATAALLNDASARARAEAR